MYSIKSNKAKKLKGIRFRLTMVYSTLFGLFICIFAYIISGQYLTNGHEEFDKALLNYSIDLTSEIDFDDKGMAPKIKIPARELQKSFPFAIGQSFYWVRSINGKVLLTGRPGFPLKVVPYKSDLALKEDYTHRYLTLQSGNDEYRALNLKITNSRGSALIVQVATLANSLRDQANSHFLINIITIPLLILIASIASYIMAESAIAPIQVVTDTANNIAAKNLSLRVPELDSEDEVAELSKTFNTLLDRLEKSFKAQENFVANASHQLNTPLAIIKGELDVLESKHRGIDDYNRFHKSLREELQRLIDLVKNMLLASRVESGQESFHFIPLRMDEILLSTSSRLSNKARDKRINLRFNISEDLPSENIEILGERQLLTSLFENILDNAIKYSPDDSTVSIDIKSNKFPLEIWIQDEGPGIHDEEFQTILKSRFQRGEKNLLPGTGIGLSIAYQIAHYHGAQISYRRLQPQGSLFIVGFTKQN
jgi:signal transduction histidine kinase